ncbi:hypothetical protein G7046_g1122 [Stylonectria norvegica]|nr:hypothetical protein G7046_g1122 [Stylonectria norvegica]
MDAAISTTASASESAKVDEVKIKPDEAAVPPAAATDASKPVNEENEVKIKPDDVVEPPSATPETTKLVDEVKIELPEAVLPVLPLATEAETVKPVEVLEVSEVVEEYPDPDEDFPDPDEDDLDDLDDMLDEFATVELESKKPAVPVTASARPEPIKEPEATSSASEKQPAPEDDFSEEEFAKQLQAGMADLLGELEQSPDMQAQFEDIFKQMSAAAAADDDVADDDAAAPPKAAPDTSAEPGADANFQETIRRTMERMQNSGDQATAAAASGTSDDFMSEMLKQMSSGDLNADGSEEEFSKMLMGMMEQLTNKEVLYEPMKELDDKFPDWLLKNRKSTPKDDLKRYEEQQAFVRDIVAKFEEKTYSDSNPADREFIVDKMQKMQAAGSPPSDLVGDMSSAQDVFNGPDESCNPQ